MGKLNLCTTSAVDEIFHLDFIAPDSGLTSNPQNFKKNIELIKNVDLITPTTIRIA